MTDDPIPAEDALFAAPVRISEHVVRRSFDSEMIVLNLSTGTYHTINPTGMRMLEALGEEGSFARSLERMKREYTGQDPATLEREMRAFYLDLAATGVIEIEC